jgi:hypothetical protein
VKGYLTSYVGLFEAQPGGAPAVGSIEIPLIQRDYAQGRPGAQIEEIRVSFLEVLLGAVTGAEPVGLDFVYGKIEGTTFHPLDGQQRLTTLFLLHWYLASAAGRLDAGAAWTRLSYATRPGARLFCKRLAAGPLPQGETVPSAWITDQAWYLHGWRADPTIQAMLVMIDAIHREIQRLHPDLEAQAAWERLTSTESPAVSFYLLPLDDMDSDEDLYIKMNSRGKPLTPFENFKARFERDIQHSDRAGDFARKIDGAWSDLLWPFHGGDNIVDDELIRYIGFITELCELREGRVVSGRLGPRARAVFGRKNERAKEHIAFLFDAFDQWQDHERISRTFGTVISMSLPGEQHYTPEKVVLFGATSINLFEQCLHNRAFTLQQSLLLYAVLLHLIEGTEDFPRRLRVLRNLIAASEDEVRRHSMPALVSDVEEIIVNGDLDAVTRFSSNQVEDERRKKRFLDNSPELADALFRLEDHPILRGTLSAFEFSSGTFRQRAGAFEAAFKSAGQWLGLTGPLLATGDYQRPRPNSEAWQFGTSSADNEAVWRYLLTDATHESLSATRAVLGDFLDGLAHATSGDTGEYFKAVADTWLAAREESSAFDWRYYLVKYPSMRGGETGIYYGVDGKLGYPLCMLRTKRLSGYYRDPILLEVWRASEAGTRVQDPWFRYETNPRWLRLEHSGAGMRSTSEGFALRGPDDDDLRPAFIDICRQHETVDITGESIVLTIPQHDHGNGLIDSTDRVVVGAAFLRALVKAGF